MRYALLIGTVLFAGTAHASSIVTLTTNPHGVGTSFVSKTCTQCPPPVEKKNDGAYRVPVLKGDVQSVVVMDIGGEKKIVRTESWMGGSPVVYINKVPAWMNAGPLHAEIEIGKNQSVEAEVQKAIAQAAPIDFTAQTGALKPKSPEQDLDKVPLRLE
jgi:hypothetical protein